MRLKTYVLAVLVLAGCTAKEPVYPPDSQSMDIPADPNAVVELPRYPLLGRSFAIERSKGAGNLMKVADESGRLEIWADQQLVESITLGPCFSFSRMDEQHDFGRQGKPEFATAPPDCRVWEGRHWNNSFKTQTSYYRNPCYYEGSFVALVRPKDGGRVVETSGRGQGVVMDSGRPFGFQTHVLWDDQLKFYREFDVGYVGKIRILSEVK